MALATARRDAGIGSEVIAGPYVIEGSPKEGRQAIRHQASARRCKVPADAIPPGCAIGKVIHFDGAVFSAKPPAN